MIKELNAFKVNLFIDRLIYKIDVIYRDLPLINRDLI